jgi:hypothetical protein
MKTLAEILPKKSPLALSKKYRAAVFSDKNGAPTAFAFDAEAFWEFCCLVDEADYDRRPIDEDGVLGPIIDAIEDYFPISEKFSAEMKNDFEAAKKEFSDEK